MTTRRARRQSALDNDERILDTAMAVAGDVGLDRLTVSAVASLAGFTSGAVYARYDDREELLVALWEHRAAAVLERFIHDVGSYRRNGADPAARASIVQWLTDPPVGLRLAIEACLIAHRVDALYEVVPRAVREWTARLGLDHAVLTPDESVDVALIAGTLGHVALRAFPDRLTADLDTALRWMSPPASPPVGDPAPPAESAQVVVLEPDDPVRNDLLVAAQSVIARSGVHRTTLSRIGRLARLAPATVYGRYDSRDELISDILHRAQVTNSQTKYRLDYFSSDAAMAAALHSFLQPAALVRRRLQNETIVAAWHNPDIATTYSSVEWQAMQLVADEFPAGIIPRDRLIAAQQVSLMAIIGSAVLCELLPETAELDWRPSASMLMRAVLTDA
jgi:AcrR family transcriptional regulator